uniref:EGF-like domain-containing protein n=1 Tax=Electrophorus electricus TaxID=8005 RepID=A0A4W4GM80_ELEEL
TMVNIFVGSDFSSSMFSDAHPQVSTRNAGPLKCRLGSRACKDGSDCVLYSHVCDGEVDCKDASDEEGCDRSCKAGEFQCAHGKKCISAELVCDGKPQCQDRSDEMDCFTRTNSCTHRCDNKTRCIPETFLCDGEKDCVDGTDEAECGKYLHLTSPSVMCEGTSLCISQSQLCDGKLDCPNGFDELSCLHECSDPGHFLCKNRMKCIERTLVCDGRNDCPDDSDELRCPTCPLHCDEGSVCLTSLQFCDGQMDCRDGTDEKDCYEKDLPCLVEQYQCASGQCVSTVLRCDGHADCHDHSDEKDCRKPPHCPLEERCPHSHECLLTEWLCDGAEDCSDGSDEQNCRMPPLQCGQLQWSCASKNQCIPASWRCDGSKDCKDQSDEAGCGQAKCPTHLFSCGNKECVDPALVCDGLSNCQDGSDEGPGCLVSNCLSPHRPLCSHYCISTPQGARCGCQEGFELQADGFLCMDIDECKISSPCSHKCVNTHGSYVCVCYPGYILEPDSSTCKTEPGLLASVQYELLFKGLRSGNLQVLHPLGQKPIFSLDCDQMEERLFWVSLEEESIKFIYHGQKDIRALVKGVKSDSIAVDWVGRNLYWVDGVAGQILAVRLSTSLVKPENYIVILDEDLEQPRSLALLPQKGIMVWSEMGSVAQIERAGMDGSDRKVVLSHGLSWPVALAVDALKDRIYWTDEKLKCIGSATLDGEDLKLLQLTETPSPFSVAVFNDMIYWSDTQRRAIYGAHKVTGKNPKVILKRPGQPFGLKVAHLLMQPMVSNPCESLRCSHMCLLTPAPRAVCRCPAGQLLATDRLTCSPPEDSSSSFLLLLSPTMLTQIFTSNLRGEVGLKRWPNHRALALPGINEATGLDFVLADNMLYLADASQASVVQLRLTDTALAPEGSPLQLPGDTVTSLAVDWLTHNLYWRGAKQPQLYVTSAGWKYTAVVLQVELQDPTSIALHPPTGRLCFTAIGPGRDGPVPQLDCVSMNGQNRMVLWKRAQLPMFLTFSSQGSTLYWADIATEVIGSVNIDGSDYREYKTGSHLIVSFAQNENIFFWITLYNGTTKVWYSDGVQPKQMWFEVQTNILALKAYSKYSQKGTNLCAENNGGCRHLCLAYPAGRTCRCTQGYLTVNKTQCVPGPRCPAGSVLCGDGYTCLSISLFCDQVPDCQDGSDEKDCEFSWALLSLLVSLSIGKLNQLLDNPASFFYCFSLCSGQGRCVLQEGEPACECLQGYSGPSCQYGGSSSAPVILAVIFLIGVLIVSAVALKKREKSAREQPIEKETLMKDMEEPETHPQNFANELYNPEEEVGSPLW